MFNAQRELQNFGPPNRSFKHKACSIGAHKWITRSPKAPCS